MNKLRFTRIRDVKTPSRGNEGDAGLDFYMPIDLLEEQVKSSSPVEFETDKMGYITQISIPAHVRVLIPSGIRVLLEPRYSMLTAANKSGIATKQGLVFMAQIIDSPYTGEVHIGILNTSDYTQVIKAGTKLTQFIHVPIYLTDPQEISQNEYEEIAKDWGTRGSGGFGSTDKN